jgi:hypothetical protein
MLRVLAVDQRASGGSMANFRAGRADTKYKTVPLKKEKTPRRRNINVV